jgi:hypothetical protein
VTVAGLILPCEHISNTERVTIDRYRDITGSLTRSSDRGVAVPRSGSGGADGSRRQYLLKLGGGIALLAGGATSFVSSDAFDLIDAGRDSTIDIASQGNGVVGVVGQGPVKKNSREAMVEFTNNGAEQVSITVTLDTTSDGTLYDNDGGSGSSVTFTLSAGNSQFVDIDADVTGTISYGVSVSSSSLDLDTTGTVESQSGNVDTDILIQAPSKNQDFTADPTANEFVVDKVDVRDDDGDNNDNLDRVEFRVREGGSSGTIVGSKDVDFSPPTDRYKPGSVTVQPNAGYALKANTTYALTVTGYHTNGNFDSETVEDTTGGTGATATATPTPTDTPSGTPTPTPTATPTPANQPPTPDFTVTRQGNSQNVELDG